MCIEALRTLQIPIQDSICKKDDDVIFKFISVNERYGVAKIAECAPTAILESKTDLLVGIQDSLRCLGEATDLVHPRLTDHHKITGFIAASLAEEMQRTLEEQETLLSAGLAHDIGAFSVRERIDVARFDAEEVFPHCLAGYTLLSQVPSLSHIANLVRHHHIRWDKDHKDELRKDGILRDGHLLHLADRIAVAFIGKNGGPLEIAKQIIEQIRLLSGRTIDPDLVDVFRCLAEKDGFWFDVTSLTDNVLSRYRSDVKGRQRSMPISEMTGLLSRVIDFRSHYTASHSKAVAVVSETLGRHCGLSPEERRRLNIAGHLHDLGKVGTPLEILEKPGKLTEQEFKIVQMHPYHTFHVLRNLEAFEDIRVWSSHHHEYLDGSGYPFRLAGEDICLYSRIVTVADIFVALTEDRPYRVALPERDAIRILGELAKNGKLDAHVVTLAAKRSDEIYACMLAVRASESQDYEAFLDSSFFQAFN